MIGERKRVRKNDRFVEPDVFRPGTVGGWGRLRSRRACMQKPDPRTGQTEDALGANRNVPRAMATALENRNTKISDGSSQSFKLEFPFRARCVAARKSSPLTFSGSQQKIHLRKNLTPIRAKALNTYPLMSGTKEVVGIHVLLRVRRSRNLVS
jgi:hypothetical protein